MSREANNRFTRDLFDEDHDAARDSFRRFLSKEVQPHYAQWERDGIIPHAVFEALGDGGYLCLAVPGGIWRPGANRLSLQHCPD